ncbi:plastocyanin/azurin family copper-binding protein [Halocatena halophila]|uniref:plastocyanin/azurin family copper-binding protein n=1 Tax=Halocatena halophila TaxID=2814576 RepID=UPI002ED4FD98
MDRRAFLSGATTVVAVGLTGCLSRSSLGATDFDIGMDSDAFDPEEFTIETGDTVIWGNPSSRAHSVTAYEATLPDGAAYFASGGFDTERDARDSWREHTGSAGGKILSGETYEHTFEIPGTYPYFCIPHENVMTGRIHVE